MWPFRHKEPQEESQYPGPSHFGSTNTRLIVYHSTDHPDYIRVWRGQRSLTYRCFDCGLDFYREEPDEEVTDKLIREAEGRVVDDDEALREAEEEIKRQLEEDDDRRCR